MSDDDQGSIELNQHPDESDRATEVEMAMTESAIRQVQAQAKRQQEPDANGVYAILDCVQCGGEIDPARLKVAAKNTLCIHCATDNERRKP